MSLRIARELRRFLVDHYCLLLIVTSFLTFGCIDSALAQTQAVNAVERSGSVIIPRSTHTLAKSAYDVGPVDAQAPMERMVLVLAAREDRETELRQLLDSQQSKGSAEYHRWLTPEEFGKRFGPSRPDIEQVKNWLAQHGFSLGAVSRGGRWIEFSGSAAQVESSFHTQMRRYNVGGIVHTANATDISVPAQLAPVVRGVLSLHDFSSKPMLTNRYQVYRDSSGVFVPTDPAFTVSDPSSTLHLLTPGDYADIYNISPLYEAGIDGSGQTIAIVARSNIDFADVGVFRTIFNLPFNDPNVILSGPDPGFTGDDATEAVLDVEWAGAIAPKANVDLVIAASTTTTDGVALSAAYIVDNNLAGVMSVSYSLCEQNLGTAGNAFYNALWQQAAAQGISVIVAAGDNGGAGCDDPFNPKNLPAQNGLAVNGLSSTPFDTAVGGTQFSENGNDSNFWKAANTAGFESVFGYIPEAVWNESCDPTKSTTCENGSYSLFAGSSGVSTLYSKPSWQNGAGVPADGKRDVPDVSLAAAGGHDGYLICSVGSCITTPDGNTLTQASVVGGTSAAAPSFAGIVALLNQKMGSRQGLLNYVLYPLVTRDNRPDCDSSLRTSPAARSQCIFNDITLGNNSVPGQVGYTAGTGFDLATGLGSVNAANLVSAWSSVQFQSSVTTLSVPSPSAQHGQAVQVTVTVAAASGGGSPSGSFVLVSDKYGPVAAGTLTNGSFTGSFTSLPGGQYNLTAHYQGDDSFAWSDSPVVAVNIATESSAISLQGLTYASHGPVPISSLSYGDFVYLHAAVTSSSGHGVATGSITFQEGSNVLGVITLNSNGEAELVSGGAPSLGAAICLGVGTHTITASYSGDSSLSSSISQPFTIVITKGNPLVFFFQSALLNIASTQQALMVGFVSNTGPSLPSGTLEFLDGTTSLGTVPIASILFPSVAQGSLQASLSPGTHTITLSYSGDAVYNASTLLSSSLPLTVKVDAGIGASTQTSLSSAINTASVGDLVTYAVKVTRSSNSAQIPTGTVQLFEPGIGPPTGPVILQNGSATIPLQWPFGGPRTVYAQYSGDSTFASSASAPVTISVLKATPSIAMVSSADIVNSGTQLTLTAAVSASIRPLVSVSSGISGDYVQFFDSLNGSPASPIGPPAALIPVTTDPVVRGWWGFTATAALPITPTDGTHLMTAHYLGSGSYSAVTSTPITVVVGARASSQATLTVDSSTPSAGQVLTFVARVTSPQSSPSPTGTVQFINSGLGVFGSSTVKNGVATFSMPWSAGGYQSVVAKYSGDPAYASSQSNPLVITLPSFQLTAGSNQLVIPAGNSAAVYLHVAPVAGFHSTVALSCGNGVPPGSTCSITPSVVTLDGVNAVSPMFSLDIAAPSAMTQPTARVSTRTTRQWGFMSVVAGALVVGLIIFPAGRMRSWTIIGMIIISLIAGFVACGGGGSATPGGGTGGGGGGGSQPTITATTTTVTSSATRIASGESIAFTATVATASVAATGTVTFYDGATQIGQSSISNGQAQLSIASLGVGTHAVTARYNGDLHNAPSTSSPLYQLVTGILQFPVTATAGDGQTQAIKMTVMIE